MSQICPLLFRQIDATVSKLSSMVVFIGLIAYLITSCKAILIFLIVDFMIRLSSYKVVSPVYQVSMFLQKILKLPVKMTDAGAKRLAAYFGLMFVIGMLIADIAGFRIIMWSFALIFMSCILLDLLFDYCIACKVYTLYRKFSSKEA